MGASTFVVCTEQTNATAAFAELVDQARREYGHSYSGTIGEKISFLILQPTPLRLDAATQLAKQLLRDADPRIDDKYGPAGALPITTDGRTISGWCFFGWAAS